MISVHTFGTSVIETDRRRFEPTAAKKFGFLLMLTAEPGRRTPRSALIDLFFDGEEGRAHHSLRELLYQMKRSGVEVDAGTHDVGIAPGDVFVDWATALASSHIDIATLRAAQGGFLPGYSPSLSEEFSAWYESFRTRTTFELAKAFNAEMNRAKDAGDWSRTEHAARACLAVDPLNGHATVTLAEMLAISGAGTKATELLDRYSAELGPAARRVSLSVNGLRRRIAEQALDRHVQQAEFPFAGRESEMLLLSRELEEATRGSAKALLLTGEPGIGKSRVLSEFARRVSLAGTPVTRLNVHPHDRRRPMGAFVSLVPQLLEQPGALGCSPKTMEWLNRLIGQPAVESEPGDQTTWQEPSRAIASAVVDLLGAITSEGRLVVIVDDVHWVDDLSLELFHELISGGQLRALLLVLASREEKRVLDVGDWSGTLVTRVLTPLDRTVAVELLRNALARKDSEDDSLAAWMADTASGNPFYADWLISHYRETGERYSVPSRISALVDQRIAALSPDARDVLETIVALGRNATTDRLATILDGVGSLLIRYVRELVNGRFIVGDTRVEAAHWLIAEGVQRNATPAAQRVLYRRIALALEAEAKESATPAEMWECAQAWLAAGDPDRAADMIDACASHALSIGRAREASDLYFQAAGLLTGDRSERFAEESIRAAISGVDPMAVLRATPLLRSRRTRQVHDDIELAETRAHVLSDNGSFDRLASLMRCIEATEASIAHRLTAARSLLSAVEQAGNIDAVRSILPTVKALLDDPRSMTHEMERLHCANQYHALLGEREHLVTTSRRFAEMAQGQRPDICVSLLSSGAWALMRAGDRAAALAVYQRAVDIAESAHLHRVTRSLRLTLASQHLEENRIEEARRWFALVQAPDGSSGDYTIEFAYLVIAADFAMYDDDREALSRICTAITTLAVETPSARIHRWQRAARYLVDHLDGAALDTMVVMRDLTAEQHAGYENGEMGDFEMCVLLTILHERGQDDVARQAFQRYVTVVRRSAARPGPTLMRIGASVQESSTSAGDAAELVAVSSRSKAKVRSGQRRVSSPRAERPEREGR